MVAKKLIIIISITSEALPAGGGGGGEEISAPLLPESNVQISPAVQKYFLMLP